MSAFRVLAAAVGLALPLMLAVPASATPRHHHAPQRAHVSTATYKVHAGHATRRAQLRTARKHGGVHVAQQHHRSHAVRRS